MRHSSLLQVALLCSRGEMTLFSVPAVVSALEHREFIGRLGLELLALIALSTLADITVTAMTVELALLWKTRHERI